MTEQWEEIEVPAGSFISWAEQPGQKVVGRVVEASRDGGTDFNDEPCPQVIIDLREPAYSINKQGQRFDHDAGDLVTINAGLANLKKAIRAADPEPGDLISIEFAELAKASKGTAKVFKVRIARGAGKASVPARPARPRTDDDPPF